MIVSGQSAEFICLFSFVVGNDHNATAGYHRYCEINRQLADDFLDRIDEGFERIRSDPEMYAYVMGKIRQMRIRRFPYVISYLLENDRVVVLAVLHGHRNPEEWKKRS
jgi:plasmid stabilization system protein ParE